eukprot:3132144-Lingulodinium_polyedra.AAC.1
MPGLAFGRKSFTGCSYRMFPVITSNNYLRYMHPFVRPSTVMSLMSHHRTACNTPTSKSSLIQLRWPSNVFSVGGL